MKPEHFLGRWKSEHINSGAQQADALKLFEELVADAENEGVRRDMLAQAAGGG